MFLFVIPPFRKKERDLQLDVWFTLLVHHSLKILNSPILSENQDDVLLLA